MLAEEKIREAAREVVRDMANVPVQDGDALVSSGLIDSLSILKLIARLEQKLGIHIPTDNLQPDDFENIDWIVDTVLRVSPLQ
jgi:acyl carrier protein